MSVHGGEEKKKGVWGNISVHVFLPIFTATPLSGRGMVTVLKLHLGNKTGEVLVPVSVCRCFEFGFCPLNRESQPESSELNPNFPVFGQV